MHQGEGIVPFGFVASEHGATNEYDFARIPTVDDPGWAPAPDADYIGFSRPSTLCGAAECQEAGDFTYFQTLVEIPSNAVVTAFTITFSGIDDGVRVTVFNSDYRNGVVVEGSYVFLGGNGTANLANLVKAGETNRVVVTQVDDCCSNCSLQTAEVVLNGDTVLPPPTLTINLATEGVAVSWNSQTGKKYQLQTALSLQSGDWSDMGAPITGDGSPIVVPDPNQDTPQKFYRAVVLP
ncbi:MAG TPA: hypothetical protein VJA21_01885 [Verrucomicrobiae bacterium]